MNFEIIDNSFQILVMLIAMFCSAVTACRKKNWDFMFLAGGYGCFMMGTLYYVLCLIITGKVPQIFYVAEISWMAAYLFFLCLLLSRRKFQKKFPGSLSIGSAALAMLLILLCRIFGPSRFFSFCFALIEGTIVLRCMEGIRKKDRKRYLDGIIVTVVWLQIILYLVSSFIKDYTRFSVYYAIDILLTLMMAAMLPALKKEVKDK